MSYSHKPQRHGRGPGRKVRCIRLVVFCILFALFMYILGVLLFRSPPPKTSWEKKRVENMTDWDANQPDGSVSSDPSLEKQLQRVHEGGSGDEQEKETVDVSAEKERAQYSDQEDVEHPDENESHDEETQEARMEELQEEARVEETESEQQPRDSEDKQVHFQDFSTATDEAQRLEDCRKLLQTPSTETGTPRSVYSVVFDIGSTGSRVHVFRLNRKDPLCADGIACLDVESELFLEDHDPISMVMQVEEATLSLDRLYDAAVNYVPADQRACTTIQFMATAGLRKVGVAKANAILSEIYQHFKTDKNNFWLRREEDCRILEGWEEGSLAWVTVNALLGRFKESAEPTAAIVDLGGGSTQIVFEPPSEIFKMMGKDFQLDLFIGARHVQAYHHSYNLGLHEAIHTLLAQVAEGGEGVPALNLDKDQEMEENPINDAFPALETHFPCFAGGFVDSEYQVRQTKEIGGADFSLCVEVIDNLLLHPSQGTSCPEGSTCGIGSTFQPSIKEFTGPFYAFSFIYDLMAPYLNSSTGATDIQETITPMKIKEVGEEICQNMTLTSLKSEATNDNERLHPTLHPPYACMYYSYIYALLTKGYGLDVNREIHIEKKINGFEASWALGSGLLSLSEERLARNG